MSMNMVYTKHMEDLQTYLQSKLPEMPVHTAQEIATHIANKTAILVNDMLREYEKNERREEWKAIRRQIRREPPIDKETFEKARSALLESDPELVEAMERDLQKSYESRWEAIHSTSYVGNVSLEELSKRIKEFGMRRKSEKAGE